jgi:hypothetical protein
MITKSDWQAVHQEMTAEERRKLGEPPTTEEMLAYSRGELSAENVERVKAWLVCNPDMARALMEPFPSDDAKPGDADFLPEEELSKRWASLQQSIHGVALPRAQGSVLRFPVWTALAAVVAVVFAGLYWQAESKLRRLSEPALMEMQDLQVQVGRRGAGAASTAVVRSDAGGVLAVSVDDSRFERFRVEIVSATTPSRLVKRFDAARPADDFLSIVIPPRSLAPGRYRIVVYGISALGDDLLGTYPVLVR